MKIPARIYCIIAREAKTAVVFRRGPSRQVLLLRWNMDKDTFEEGQWFKGRIYERRCDLSPYGDKLIYFAATYKKPLESWTAISKPPWLTALALWPKGDGWNGGGYFLNQNEIILNHFPGEDVLHPDFSIKGVKVAGLAEYRGEDDTVQHHLMERAGWKFIQNAVWEDYSYKKGWVAKIPEIWTKAHPRHPLTLKVSCHGIAGKNRAWYNFQYELLNAKEDVILDLGSTDWAEWDQDGDLIFAKDGKLHRAKTARSRVETPLMIIDLNDRVFQAIDSPEWAKSW